MKYRNFNGTSASCPVVTGSVALIKSIYPDISNSQLKAFLLNNVDVVDGLKGKLVTGGVLNIGKHYLRLILKSTQLNMMQTVVMGMLCPIHLFVMELTLN